VLLDLRTPERRNRRQQQHQRNHRRRIQAGTGSAGDPPMGSKLENSPTTNRSPVANTAGGGDLVEEGAGEPREFRRIAAGGSDQAGNRHAVARAR
jgi:hypothetical protein